MKTKFLILGALLIMVIGVNAQPGFRRGMNNSDSGQQKMIRERIQRQIRLNEPGLAEALQLNEEQIKSFKEMKLSMHKEIQSLRNQLGEAHAHQKTLIQAEDPDMDAINKNIDKIGELRTKIEKIRAKYQVQMRAQLNDEQRMKIDRWKEMRKHRSQMQGMQKRMQGFNLPDRKPGGQNWPEMELRIKELNKKFPGLGRGGISDFEF